MESKQVSWTPAMSAYMLAHLVRVAQSKTCTGFKQSHLNACAKDLNEHFQLSLTATQIHYHNRNWRRKFGNILQLKKLSGAGWDEEQHIIVLDPEHYANHVQVPFALLDLESNFQWLLK